MVDVRVQRVRSASARPLQMAGLTMLLVLLFSTLAHVTPESARAAFPGTNGEIVFGRYPIHAVDPGTGVVRSLATGQDPTISPDGSRLLYYGGDGHWRVMTMAGVGGQSVTEGLSGYVNDASWRPDGDSLVLVRQLTDGGPTSVWTMNLDGSGLTKLIETPAGSDDAIMEAVSSPAGDKIAYTKLSRGCGPCARDSDVWVMGADGGGNAMLTTTDDPVEDNSPLGRDETSPDWSPDGTRILFTRNTYPSSLHHMAASGGGETRVPLPENASAISGSFAPDGTQLAIHVEWTDVFPDDPKNGLYTSAIDGGGFTQLHSDHRYLDPDWGVDDPTPDIVETYAPRIVFHPDEQHWPMSIGKFINNSSLRWAHNAGCDDDYVVRDPTAKRLGGRLGKPYAHSTKGFACRHRDDKWRSNDFSRPRTEKDDWGRGRKGLEKNEGFVLNLKDSKRHGTASKHADPTQYSGSNIYYDYNPEQRWIRFFVMYGWSEIPGGTGDEEPSCCHEGEWEGFTIKLDENNEPTQVFLNQHHGGMLVDWEDMRKVDGTHPVIFSAEGAHASYPSEGPWFVSVATDYDMTADGLEWDTWEAQTERVDVREQGWWGFGGGWGDMLGAKANLPHFGTNFVGPLGPSRYMRSSPWACGATTPCWPGGEEPPRWP